METSGIHVENMKRNEFKPELFCAPSIMPDEKESNSPDPILSGYNEEASYHELRCLSNDEINPYDMLPMEYEDCDDIINIIEQPNTYKFYKNTDNCISSSENTDDQLLIEIVKEEINFKHEQNEATSIFDSVTFSSRDENIEHIQLVENIIKTPVIQTATSPAKFILFKKPQELQQQVVLSSKPQRKRFKKASGLGNYTSLITQAIKSSPQKRMLLTEIYSWVIRNIPFFQQKEVKASDTWKNGIRHQLSVNKTFVRLKNHKGKSSYWTVNEYFKKYMCPADLFTPEERKRGRGRPKMYRNMNDKIVKRCRGRPEMIRNRMSVDEIAYVSTKKRKRGRPRMHHKIENLKRHVGRQKINRKNEQNVEKKKVNDNITYNKSTMNANSNNSNNLVVNEVRRSQRNAIKSLKINNDKNSSDNENESIRRSSRKRVIRKIWSL